MGSSIAYHLKSDPALHRQRRRGRARSDLCTRLVGVVGQLDPPAILDAAQHPSVALWHRLPAAGGQAAGRRSRARRSRATSSWRARRARRCCGPTTPSRRARAARSSCSIPRRWRALSRGCRTEGVPLASHGVGQRRLVRRPGPDAGLPPQGARARRAATLPTRSWSWHPTPSRCASGGRLEAGTIVLAAGPGRVRSPRSAGIALPVEPRRRSVFVFDVREPPAPTPLTIDPSGTWFRPEGRFYIGGTDAR